MNNAVHLDKVCKSLGNRQILKDISLDVGRGSIFGFLGPNGAGKTTTIRIILGLFKPDSGTAEILGKNVATDASRQKTGFVLEADGLYDNNNARDNLSFYSRFYGLDTAVRNRRIEEVLRLVGLADRAGDKVSVYSKGMRQKLAIARAMVHEPELLVMDEPTSGVDPTGQVEVREIILNLARNGKTVFLSSHNLDEVQRICDRVALVNRGEIRLQGSLAELRGNPDNRELEVKIREELSPIRAEEIGTGLKGLSFIKSYRYEKSRFILSVSGEPELGKIIEVLAQHNLQAEEIRKEQGSLEEIYTRAMREAGQ
jgi:ABC-2 type transport system ATP-binding protein